MKDRTISQQSPATMKSFRRFPSRGGSSHKGEQFNSETQRTSKFTPIKSRGLFKRKEPNKFSPRRKISFFRRKNTRLNLVDQSLKSKNDPMDAASSASSATEEKAFIEDAESRSFESLDEKKEVESDIHSGSRSSDNVVITDDEPEVPTKIETIEKSIVQEKPSIQNNLSEDLEELYTTKESIVQEESSFIDDEALSEGPREEFSQDITFEQETVILQNYISLEQTKSLIPEDSSLPVELKKPSKNEETGKIITTFHASSIVITSTFLFYVIGGLELISNLVGFFYPAYMSLKTIESAKNADNTQWVTYWIVFSIFSMIESTIPFLKWFVPYYFHFKIGFFLWLYHPKVMGAKKVYNDAFRA